MSTGPSTLGEELSIIQRECTDFSFHRYSSTGSLEVFSIEITLPLPPPPAGDGSASSGSGSSAVGEEAASDGEGSRAVGPPPPLPTVLAVVTVKHGPEYPDSVCPSISLRYTVDMSTIPKSLVNYFQNDALPLPVLEQDLKDFSKAQLGTSRPTLELVRQTIAVLTEAGKRMVSVKEPQSETSSAKPSPHPLQVLSTARFSWDREAKGYFSKVADALTKNSTAPLADLQQSLLQQVGDDVIVGELHLDEKKMELRDETVPKPQGSLETHREKPKSEFNLLTRISDSLSGLPCPATLTDLYSLYQGGTQSQFGIDGIVGDVLDTTKRRSSEYLASHFHFGYPFDVFDFPETVAKIKQILCPTAEKIAIRPYKVILYQPGDFFSVHVDTMKHALQFGSLAVELPVDDFCFDAEPPPLAGAATNVHKSRWNVLAEEEERRSSGDLCFYLGRCVDPSASLSAPESQEMLLQNHFCYNTYNRATDDSSTMTCRMKRRRYRDCVVQGAPEAPTKLSLQFAAWRGDVHHELKKLACGWRMVLIYRMFKVGEAPLRIPMHHALSDKVEKCFAVIRAAQEKLIANPKARSGDVRCRLRCLGFILRHQYPPAGLHPSGLKGIDAVVWKLCSQKRHCVLTPATEMREDELSSPFRMNAGRYGAHVRTIFLTKERLSNSQPLCHERSFEKIVDKYPLILDCLWIQLGFGMLEGGGACFGNADCGTDWWYRTAVLIVTPDPSPFHRRLPAFLAGLRGPPTMQRLYQCFDVFQHMVGYL